MLTPPFAGHTMQVVVTAAGPAGQVGELVELAHAHGWTVQIIATPAAVQFLDTATLQTLTGQPVRSSYCTPQPTRARSLPDTSAVIVAPATFNTINKAAAGISDNYALGVLAEAIGRRLPVIIVPFLNTALAARQPFTRAITHLRAEGVRILLGENDGWTPHPPGTGNQRIPTFPWATALHHAEDAAADGGVG